MLAAKGLRLDAAIELTVDAGKLVERIVNRAEQARASGQPVRKDDDPEVFKSRLAAYERDTAAVTPFYRERGLLHEVDGMAAIDEVAKAIDGVLSEGRGGVTAAASPHAEALVERRGRAGFIVLNRPKALNALTLSMVRLIAPALAAWEHDRSVDRVVLLGAGDRAFCAGGDIRQLYELGRAGDHDGQLTFWREEYQLDRRIKTYPKPIVSLADGIVMGGGVGLSVNASHPVVGERYVFAMPEVGIGFFPDVGATWFLPRLPYRAGVYFALTACAPGRATRLRSALLAPSFPARRSRLWRRRWKAKSRSRRRSPASLRPRPVRGSPMRLRRSRPAFRRRTAKRSSRRWSKRRAGTAPLPRRRVGP